METYLEHAPCLFFSSTDEGTLLEVNEALCTQLGYARTELAGKRTDTIFTLATRIFHQTHLFPLLKMQGFAEEIFLSLQTKSKEQVPVLLNASRKTVNGQPVMLYAAIVVEHRKKFEDELIAAKKAAEAALRENTALMQAKQELQQHLEQLDRQMVLVNRQNEELRQFNRVVTHDLQEPLRKLSIFTHMIIEDEGKKSLDLLVEKLTGVAGQMGAIVSGLQQYVWLTESPLQPAVVDLNQLLNAVQRQLEREFSPVRLVLEKEGVLPPVIADPGQMELLLYHLLSNAIRFRKPGQEPAVVISATILELNQFRNMAGKYKYRDFLKLEITDRGEGFDAYYKEQVLELFKRLHPESGRGVGLALCKKVAESHGGTIAIDSRPGEGTTVTVLLPAEQGAQSLP